MINARKQRSRRRRPDPPGGQAGGAGRRTRPHGRLGIEAQAAAEYSPRLGGTGERRTARRTKPSAGCGSSAPRASFYRRSPRSPAHKACKHDDVFEANSDTGRTAPITIGKPQIWQGTEHVEDEYERPPVPVTGHRARGKLELRGTGYGGKAALSPGGPRPAAAGNVQEGNPVHGNLL